MCSSKNMFADAKNPPTHTYAHAHTHKTVSLTLSGSWDDFNFVPRALQVAGGHSGRIGLINLFGPIRRICVCWCSARNLEHVTPPILGTCNLRAGGHRFTPGWAIQSELHLV